jgi:hypothetical protein
MSHDINYKAITEVILAKNHHDIAYSPYIGTPIQNNLAQIFEELMRWREVLTVQH